MSALATPIPPARFAAALPALPLSSLHAKAAELRNAIIHLLASNTELRPFAVDGDRECVDAIQENEEVIRRMEERIELLRVEVEGRGFLWDPGDVHGKEPGEHVGIGEGVEGRNGLQGGGDTRDGMRGEERRGGSLGVEELARRLRERMEGGDDSEDGLHL